MSDDQVVNLIRDEFRRLNERLDMHFQADESQDRLCNQHHTEWRVFKWVGGLTLTSLFGWLNFK